jgi:two-component system cell cycle sensor histidine kinase/response regulator CckA
MSDHEQDADQFGQRIAELLRDNDELRSILDWLPLAVLVKDRNGRFLYVNHAAAPAYGATAATLTGRIDAEFMPEGNDLAGIRASDVDVIDTGRPLSLPNFVFYTSEGRARHLVLGRYRVHFQGEPSVLLTAYDTTSVQEIAASRRQLELKLAEKQRLESLGLLAGGIAHDFNNLLVGVFANAELALREVPTDSKAATYLGRLNAAGKRLADLTRQMLAYSGRGRVEVTAVDVCSAAAEILELLRASIPATIALEPSLPAGLPPVRAERGQLSQVILNLVTNAAESIGSLPGTVRVTVRSEYFDPAMQASLAVRPLREPGQYVCIEVRDDGCGMDRATRERIFDPFFTTKATGRGLGLASTLGIVRAHQGGLQVDSTPGEGTCMRVWLPPAERLPVVTVSTPPQPRISGGRVLIIDDEPVVLQAESALLAAEGYEVHTAENGETALTTLQRLGSVDAVILDMTMPGRPVQDTYEALRTQLPDVPVLLCSGFNDPEVLERLLSCPNTLFVQKPFTTDELVRGLARLVSGGGRLPGLRATPQVIE